MKDTLLDELERVYEDLARAFYGTNPSLTDEQLTEAALRTIFRLVFCRFIEDRMLEPENFIGKYMQSKKAWQQFISDCESLDARYNNGVFTRHFIDADTFTPPAQKDFTGICKRMANPAHNYDVIPFHIFGSMYERFLDKIMITGSNQVNIEEKPEARKTGGVFYTPEDIVFHIVHHTVGKRVEGKTPLQISRMRFADIACGSGSFLIAVFDTLLTCHSTWYNENQQEAKQDGCTYVTEIDEWVLSLRQKHNILIHNIFGIEIDKQAVELTKISLCLRLLDDKTGANAHELNTTSSLFPDLSKNIICGNSLLERNILKEGSFDAIVGNPPYLSYYSRESAGIDSRTEDYLRSHYGFLKGFSRKTRINSVMFFLERYCKLASPEGSVGCIIDFNVFEHAFTPIRKYIIENCAIREIMDDITGFKGVASGQVILIFDNKKIPDNTLVWKKGFGGAHREIMQSRFHNEEKSYQWEYRRGNGILEEIEAAGIPLDDLVTVLSGVAVNATEEGKGLFISEIKMDPKHHPLLEGGYSIPFPYAVPNYKSYINYDKNLQNRLNNEFEARYLKEKGSHQRPFNLRELTCFDQPKIFVRQSDVRLTASYSEDLLFGNYSLFTIIDENQSKPKLLYLLGLLNSRLLSYYGIEKGIVKIRKGKTPQIRSGQRGPLGLRQIPIIIDDNEPAFQEIIQLVQRMMKVQENRTLVSEETDIANCEEEINHLTHEIDKVVYGIYGISSDTRKIIEKVKESDHFPTSFPEKHI